MGYLIALDDFQESPAWLPLTELAAFIKVDVLLSSELEQQRLSKTFAKKHLRLVAEKVESYDDFQRTLGWGYSFSRDIFSAGRKCSRATIFHPTSSTTCAFFRQSIKRR
jgi:EAL and modified HD-GYP domain-containing signal transduction protein